MLIYVFLFILIIIVIIFIIYDTNTYGTYVMESETICSSDNCNIEGEKEITYRCKPSIYGYGCKDPKTGKISLDHLLVKSKCKQLCTRSNWTILNESECKLRNGSICGNNGIKETTLLCNSTGVDGHNQCNLIDYNQIIEVSGVTGPVPLMKNYNVGDTVTITQICSNKGLTACGSWITPLNGPDCIINQSYILSNNCDTGKDNIYLYDEGYILTEMKCPNEENVGGITYKINCKNLTPPICENKSSFSPMNVMTNSNICGVTGSPPSCLSYCRSSISSIDPGIFKVLTDNYFILLLGGGTGEGINGSDDISVLSPAEIPKIEPPLSIPSIPLISKECDKNNTNLTCNEQYLSEGILFRLSIQRLISDNECVAVVITYINNNFFGYLNYDNNIAYWTQGKESAISEAQMTYDTAKKINVKLINGKVNMYINDEILSLSSGEMMSDMLYETYTLNDKNLTKRSFN